MPDQKTATAEDRRKSYIASAETAALFLLHDLADLITHVRTSRLPRPALVAMLKARRHLKRAAAQIGA